VIFPGQVIEFANAAIAASGVPFFGAYIALSVKLNARCRRRFYIPLDDGHCHREQQLPFSGSKKAGREAGIKGVNHQMLRRTCSTYMAQITTVKDVRAHLRHANAATTLEHYIKSVPASVHIAVESLDLMLKSKAEGSEGMSN
jgi:integrase